MSSGSASGPASARAFWVTAPGQSEIRAVELPPRGPHDVIVRTLYTGISRGTESLVFAGKVPEAEWRRMRAPFQEGEFPGPVKYGYSNVGIVEQGPDALEGQPVFSLYPHQTRFVVPDTAVHVIPGEVPPGRGVLAANMETAINGVWDANPQPGERVVVLGAGTVGCLVAWLLQTIERVPCVLSDINPRRAAVAEALGVSFEDPAQLTDDAQVVVHTSGSPAGLVRALEVAAEDGRIIEMSWYGDQLVPLPLGGAFHSRRLTIKSSQVGSIPPTMREQWTHGERLDLALRLLADPALDVLVSGESGFEELPVIMPALVRFPGETLCHRIRY
jgi:2-desacetyl-2-hydroxyethyl bacteriochlorophyllide A dehydrogenase